jgi:hypothetical protein
MKAIIIQDSDAANLLDLLQLEKFSDPQMWSHNETWHSLPESTRKDMAATLHKKFHYIVCRWLQEQGASCVR